MKRTIKVSRGVNLGQRQPVRDLNDDLSDPKTFALNVLLIVVALAVAVPITVGILLLIFGQ